MAPPPSFLSLFALRWEARINDVIINFVMGIFEYLFFCPFFFFLGHCYRFKGTYCSDSHFSISFGFTIFVVSQSLSFFFPPRSFLLLSSFAPVFHNSSRSPSRFGRSHMKCCCIHCFSHFFLFFFSLSFFLSFFLLSNVL